MRFMNKVLAVALGSMFIFLLRAVEKQPRKFCHTTRV